MPTKDKSNSFDDLDVNKSLTDINKSHINTMKNDSGHDKKIDEDVIKSSGLLDAYERFYFLI